MVVAAENDVLEIVQTEVAHLSDEDDVLVGVHMDARPDLIDENDRI